jgi:hypothetical protein
MPPRPQVAAASLLPLNTFNMASEKSMTMQSALCQIADVNSSKKPIAAPPFFFL